MKIVHAVKVHFNNGNPWVEDRWKGVPMTDKERWIRNEKLLYHAYDTEITRRFTDVVRGMEMKGWRPRVVEVRRSKLRQATLLATGFSRTLRSKHLRGRAMDVIDARWKWADTPIEFMVDLALLAREQELGTGVLWGLKGELQMERVVALHQQRRFLLVKLLTARRGWDPCHCEVV